MTITDRIWSRIVTMCGRKTYYQKDLDKTEYGTREPATETDDLDQANLVSSELPNGMHAPVIDMDYAVHLVPSSTPGKYHLYIDKQITWDQYYALLKALYEADLIEAGWFQTAVSAKRTYVRLPHIKKPQTTQELIEVDTDISF